MAYRRGRWSAAFDVTGLDGERLSLTGEGIENGFDFNYAETIGDTVITNFVFNRENSNIDAILNALPVALDYEINALINPTADTTIRGFLTDSSAYQVEVDLNLPLYGSADRFTVRDTIGLDLNGRYENIREVTLRLTADNGLPVALEVEGTFLDGLGNPTGKLTAEEITVLEAAPIDANGAATERSKATHDYLFSGPRPAQTAPRRPIT